jgi:uncharacterized Tic20 family protein
MSSNPPSSAADWPAPGPASPQPLDALPAPEDDGWQAGPGRWPTTRAPWPGAGAQNAAGHPEREPAGPAWVVTQERVASGAAAGRRDAGHPQPEEERLAMLGYLGVPFLGPVLPLAVYLARNRSSGFIRYHAAQALSLWITALLYTVCVLVLGAMLALDSLNLALVIAVPLAALLWLAILGFVVRAASRAYRGSYYRIPSWLCATIVR